MNNVNKQRSSNLELYRIIVMFLIVCHHYVVNSGLMEVMGGTNALSSTSLFYYIFGAWGKTGINCFVLITGYFMCKSEITFRKFMKLYLQIIFYAFAIYGCFIFIGRETFSIKYIIKIFIPFRHIISDNFVHAYIVWWMFIPFMNAMVNHITKQQHKLLIGFTLTLFSLYQYLPDFGVALNPICWFSTLYFVASFIRLYPDSIFRINNSYLWGIFTLISVLLGIASILGTIYYRNVTGSGPIEYWLVSDSHAPFAFLISVTSFIFFKSLKIKYSKIINNIAATTFGVLLIHTNSDNMRILLWNDVFDCKGHYDCDYYWLYATISCVILFCVCSLIENIRIHTIEKKLMSYIDR